MKLNPECEQYLRTMRHILHRPLHAGFCPRCGMKNKHLYRLATQNVCANCLRLLFQMKINKIVELNQKGKQPC